MKTRIIIEAEMSDEQTEALVSEIKKTTETIGIKTKTNEVMYHIRYEGTNTYRNMEEKVQQVTEELNKSKRACNENYVMTDKEKEWTSLHLGAAIEMVERIFKDAPIDEGL